MLKTILHTTLIASLLAASCISLEFDNPLDPANGGSVVSFDINGGTGTTPDAQLGARTIAVTLPGDNGFSRRGFEFERWNTNAVGTGSDYRAGAEFRPTGDVTLYARWTEIQGNQTPVASDFEIGNLTQTVNNVTAVSITAKSGKSGGAITIYYNGSMILPAAAGNYPVTFDVGAASGWNAAAGLEGGTLTISSHSVEYGTLDYGGQSYRTVVIGSQIWMAENLNFAGSGGDIGVCYNNQVSNCNTYGRLYRWNEVMNLPASCNSSLCASQVQSPHQGICPAGWHVPTDADWTALTTAVGSPAGTKLKSQTGWNTGSGYIPGTDEFGFSALPGGYGWDGDFSGAGRWGLWWSATEGGADDARYRYMYRQLRGLGLGQ